ncbi:GNAT family N-acetyltransferase [Aureimonas pseudogalii]|uniref:GNAT superfamily N-acetyltransferase n=1 Tax=Aureimonas pseudogalii TaxID=1744844 RepID=A0A7W6H672_9HYPH|nr:GNAT family N-acetyltransferase [Aureimonas pseudogalii]MBB3999218.1 GNAT superfamily N-acetyltransferase [Aureimonas pseudogalii]
MIRPIEAADQTEWQRLWSGYQAFYKVEIEPAVTRRTFERLLDPAEPMFAALAMHDGRPVGLVHFLFHRSTWTSGDYCYLQDLFVESDMRGHSIGRRLIEHVYEEACRAEASRVYWLTHETNQDAMQLYDRIADRSGFLQYRRLLN